MLEIAKEGKLPNDLKAEAVTTLNSNPDRQIRAEAARVLPLPNAANGRPLPPIGFLVRSAGDAERGRAVFYREGANACAACHRVQGRGQWVGPDLSTIGAKYGKDELFRSIINPNAAIGYNFRSLVLALKDGRTVTGLPVEDAADHVVVKTAEGKRVTIPTVDIDERKQSEISLMPEGLAQGLQVQELVDVVTFLSGLRKPVSIIGEYQAIGPFADSADKPAIDVSQPIDSTKAIAGLNWRRITADAEGQVDPSTFAGNDRSKVVYLHASISSPAHQGRRGWFWTRRHKTSACGRTAAKSRFPVPNRTVRARGVHVAERERRLADSLAARFGIDPRHDLRRRRADRIQDGTCRPGGKALSREQTL